MLGAKHCAATAGLAHAALCRPFQLRVRWRCAFPADGASRVSQHPAATMCVANFGRRGRVTHSACGVPDGNSAGPCLRTRAAAQTANADADDLTHAPIRP